MAISNFKLKDILWFKEIFEPEYVKVQELFPWLKDFIRLQNLRLLCCVLAG